MRTRNSSVVGRGTPQDLVWATELGARLATRRRCAAGRDVAAIPREVLAEFREDFATSGFDVMTQETLMAAVQRAVIEVLA